MGGVTPRGDLGGVDGVEDWRAGSAPSPPQPGGQPDPGGLQKASQTLGVSRRPARAGGLQERSLNLRAKVLSVSSLKFPALLCLFKFCFQVCFFSFWFPV